MVSHSLQNSSTYVLWLEVKSDYAVSAAKQIAYSSHEAGEVIGSALRGQGSTGAGYPQRWQSLHPCRFSGLG